MLDPEDRSRRLAAGQLTRELVDTTPSILALGDVDLSDSLEQAFFGVLRREPPPSTLPGTDRLKAMLRVAAAGVRGIAPATEPTERVAVLVKRSIRATVFGPVGAELQRRGLPEPLLVSVDPRLVGRREASLDLTRQLGPNELPRLLRFVLAVSSARLPLDAWHDIAPQVPVASLAAAVRQTLPRLAVDAARVDAMVRRLRPTALVAFQEVGPWARIIPAVGRARGVPTIDLPHAEANDPMGASRLAYDAIAVYGPRSAQMLADAGVEPGRIHQIGPLRFDALVRATAGNGAASPSDSRRVIWASQPTKDRAGLTVAAKHTTYRSAIAAALVAAPSELVVRPHPNESLADLRRLVASEEAPSGVRVMLESTRDLHDLLPGAWLMVTGASQAVYEAAIAGVPSISVSADARSLVTHVAEGFSLGATDAESTADAARQLLRPEHRAAVIDRARSALRDRFGDLDGRAAERAAELIHGLVGR
jgi:hypothetical protein